MRNFCTLFDVRYLTRGLALYNSLLEHCRDFKLYVFCFDHQSYSTLMQLKLKKIVLVSLQELEDEELLAIKPERSEGEYCWTCTPSTIKYVLDHFDAAECTYLDADLYFFDDPGILLNEMGAQHVLLTEHRYTKRYDQSEACGIYCVQFMNFRNTEEGRNALNWWRNACIEWCYDRFEEGKFGDQKYLDDWIQRFEGVHVLQHLGGGIAPWNCQQYIARSTSQLVEANSGKEFNLIFYHFHACKFLENGQLDAGNYLIPDSIKHNVYKAYAKAIVQAENQVDSVAEGAKVPKRIPKSEGSDAFVDMLKRKVRRTYNMVELKK